MAVPVIQTSFAAGELSPLLYARVDLAKYQVGAALLQNFYPDIRGGATSRPGTRYIGRCLPGKNRLISFQFNTLQTYILVFSDQAMRVVRSDGLVTETDFSVTAITKTLPMTMTVPGNNFQANDWVFTDNAGGMTEVNGETYIVAAVSGDVISLNDLDGNPVDARAFTTYTGGAIAARIFTLTTPYVGTALESLKFAQSADVMTLVHPDYAPRNLTRTGHAAWTLDVITFASIVQPPVSVDLEAIGTGSGTPLHYTYAITSILDSTGEESQMQVSPTITHFALNQNEGVNVQLAWGLPATGPTPDRYNIYKVQPVGITAQTPTVFGYIGQTTGNQFVDSNFAPDFTQTPPLHYDPFDNDNNPGVVTYFQQRKVFAASDAQPETFWMTQTGNFANMDRSIPVRDSDAITGTLASLQVNAIEFMVPMTSGIIALSSGGAWQISGGAPGTSITPTNAQAQPQAFNGCHFHVPPIPINYDILYVQTKGAIVRDLAYDFYRNVYTGTDLTVMSNHLFFGYQIQEWSYAEEPWKLVWAVRNDGVLLSMTFMKEQDVYAWARHYTQGYFKSVSTIPELPNARSLSQEDATYFVVERTMAGVNDGEPVQYIERLVSRNIQSGGVADVTKPWAVDCGLSYEGVTPDATLTAAAPEGTANIGNVLVTYGGLRYQNAIAVVNDPTGHGATLTVAVVNSEVTAVTVTDGGSGYTNPAVEFYDSSGAGFGAIAWAKVTNDVPLAASADVFTSDMVGWSLRISGGLGTITSVIDARNITANITLAITGTLQALPGDWAVSEPISTIGHLGHLEGETVSILADGSVIPSQVVTNGQITLPQPAGFVKVGLPYVCRIKTLRLDVGNPTIQDEFKSFSRYAVRVADTRGLQVGPSFDDMIPYKERNQSQPYGSPIRLITDDEGMPVLSRSDRAGQICIEQTNPLPAQVLGVIPWVSVGRP